MKRNASAVNLAMPFAPDVISRARELGSLKARGVPISEMRGSEPGGYVPARSTPSSPSNAGEARGSPAGSGPGRDQPSKQILTEDVKVLFEDKVSIPSRMFCDFPVVRATFRHSPLRGH